MSDNLSPLTVAISAALDAELGTIDKDRAARVAAGAALEHVEHCVMLLRVSQHHDGADFASAYNSALTDLVRRIEKPVPFSVEPSDYTDLLIGGLWITVKRRFIAEDVTAGPKWRFMRFETVDGDEFDVMALAISAIRPSKRSVEAPQSPSPLCNEPLDHDQHLRCVMPIGHGGPHALESGTAF